MTIQDAKTLKKFFLEYGVLFEEIVLKADVFLIVDLDLFFYRFHEAAVKKILLINNDYVAYYETMVKSFLMEVANILLFYSRLNNESFRVRHVRLVTTFSEKQSRYMELKEWTRKKRNAGGYAMVEMEEGSTCCELYLTESDPLKWVVLPGVNRAMLAKTRAYIGAVFDHLLGALNEMLGDFWKLTNSPTVFVGHADATAEVAYWNTHVVGEMQVDTIHMYGWKARKCVFDFTSEKTLVQNISLLETTLHSGEADLYVHNEAVEFQRAQETYTIVYEFGDGDCFPILLNLNRALTFPHGFYLNSGIISKDKVMEPYNHDGRHIRFRKSYRNVYFWMDVVACRKNFLPLQVDVIIGEPNYGYFDRFKKKYCDSGVSTKANSIDLQSKIIAAFSIACILRGTDFTPSFSKGRGTNLEAFMLRLLDGNMNWKAIENRVKPPPPKKRHVEKKNEEEDQDEGEEGEDDDDNEDSSIPYAERVRENLKYWKIANIHSIFPAL